MIVLNKEDHIIQIPSHDPSVKVTVEKGVPLLQPTDLVMLLPGTNEVQNEKWQFARMHIGKRLGKTILEHLVTMPNAADPLKPSVRPKKIKEFDNEDLSELIRECNHEETLNRWKAVIADEEIRIQIYERIEQIKKGKKSSKKKARDDDDDDGDD